MSLGTIPPNANWPNARVAAAAAAAIAGASATFAGNGIDSITEANPAAPDSPADALTFASDAALDATTPAPNSALDVAAPALIIACSPVVFRIICFRGGITVVKISVANVVQTSCHTWPTVLAETIAPATLAPSPSNARSAPWSPATNIVVA